MDDDHYPSDGDRLVPADQVGERGHKDRRQYPADRDEPPTEVFAERPPARVRVRPPRNVLPEVDDRQHHISAVDAALKQGYALPHGSAASASGTVGTMVPAWSSSAKTIAAATITPIKISPARRRR